MIGASGAIYAGSYDGYHGNDTFIALTPRDFSGVVGSVAGRTVTMNADGGLTNVRALQTEVYYDVVDPNIKNLFDWAMGFLPQADISKHAVDHYWIAKYNRGDFTLSHNHYPCLYSFVYFMNSPKGSSPLVFTTSEQSIEAKNGRIVIFPAILKHHVPDNQCDN